MQVVYAHASPYPPLNQAVSSLVSDKVRSVPALATLKKVFVNDIPIAQKSLSKLSDRIENASHTIFIQPSNSQFKRVLVIDDAVGSGATLNIIAAKLKKNAGVEFVCGFAVTGSLKGFEVVNEI